MPHITRCITEPIRDSRNLSFDQRLKAEDSGLILAWENGRRDQSIELDLKQSFEKGALPLAVWKGGANFVADRERIASEIKEMHELAKSKGYTSAFIVAFENGKKIPVENVIKKS